MHQLLTESPESQKRSIASFTIVLLNKLQISEFAQQSPHVRQNTIDTLSQVLSSEYATDETKRQLLTFVDDLLRAKEISKDAKKSIAGLLNELIDREFTKKVSQIKRVTIDVLARVLISEYTGDEDKKQLLSFADGLLKHKEVSRDVKKAIVFMLIGLAENDRIPESIAAIASESLHWWNHPGL